MAKIFREKKCIFRVWSTDFFIEFYSRLACLVASLHLRNVMPIMKENLKSLKSQLQLPPIFSTVEISKESKAWGGYGQY